MLDFGQAILWEWRLEFVHASRRHGLANSVPFFVKDIPSFCLCQDSLCSVQINSDMYIVDRSMSLLVDSAIA